MRIRAAIIPAALALIAVGAVLYAQETKPVPGFGSGIVRVEGTVDIGNAPVVLAHQVGEWKVVLAAPPDVRVVNVPNVSIPGPEFVKKGGRYEITWSTGERQVIRALEIAPGGWLRAEAGDRQRWVNLASARAVDEMP